MTKIYGEGNPAPAEYWVYYMAVFRRTFLAVSHYADTDDREGMVAGGHLADALHNVPKGLWNYDPLEDPESRTSLSSRGWWLENQPELLRQERVVPHRLIAEVEAIVGAEGTAEALALSSDFSDLQLAPLEKQRQYLGYLYGACLSIRHITEYSPLLRPYWLRELPVSKRVIAKGRFNGVLTRVLQEVPLGLVRWSCFDEERFWRDVTQLREYIPKANCDTWYFEPESQERGNEQ